MTASEAAQVLRHRDAGQEQVRERPRQHRAHRPRERPCPERCRVVEVGNGEDDRAQHQPPGQAGDGHHLHDPRGAVTAAPTVSSAALAEASKPVIVYAGAGS